MYVYMYVYVCMYVMNVIYRVPCLFQLSYEFFLISVQLSPKKKIYIYTFYFNYFQQGNEWTDV